MSVWGALYINRHEEITASDVVHIRHDMYTTHIKRIKVY